MTHDRTIYGSLFFVFLVELYTTSNASLFSQMSSEFILISIGRLKEGEILANDVILLCHIKATNKSHIYLNINRVGLVYSV